MAIASTTIVNNNNYKVFNITCLDADTGPTAIPHGFGAAPVEVTFTKHVSAALAPEWAITVDAVNITYTKQATAGSGGAVPGTTVVLTVYARRPHSNAR